MPPDSPTTDRQPRRALQRREPLLHRRCTQPGPALAQLETACFRLIDQYRASFKGEQVMRDIWSGMLADKRLAELELTESGACGTIPAQAMARAHKARDTRQFAARAFMIRQVGKSMRLAIAVAGQEGASLASAFRKMTLHEILQP